MGKVSKEVPLSEITLRKYERPYETDRRSIIKKLCLSIGLLQPGDSRDVVVDVLQAVLDSEKPLNSEEIGKKVIELRKNAKIPILGVAPSNIRRQLKRLRDIYLVDKQQNNYMITENENLITLFEEKIEKFYLKAIVERIKEYCKALK
ncbi:MAG: hypothetical protein U9Q69_02580 [Nanoarchaeota archaeon]|nr:hypothetical protein [Nanoarchaeota archaeon]